MRDFHSNMKGVFGLAYVHHCDDDNRRLKLGPVGLSRQPASIGELDVAVKQLCACLFDLHSRGYVHCDVHWGSMVYLHHRWVLMDCDLACGLHEHAMLRERSSVTFRRNPVRVKDTAQPWDATFDFYQVGRMLEAVGALIEQSSALVNLRDLQLSRTFNTAQIQCCVHAI